MRTWSNVCASGARNGTAANPITIKAEHERQAFLKGDGSDIPLRIINCSYWVIDGLHAEDLDCQGCSYANDPSYGGYAFVFKEVNNLIIRRNVLRYNNRYMNSTLFYVRGNNNLIEENEWYNWHRHGLNLDGVLGGGTYANNIVRRNYANSRGWGNISNGVINAYGQNRGDSSFVIYNGNGPVDGTIFENNIGEGQTIGFNLNAVYSTNDGTRYLGNIALFNGRGFSFQGGATGTFNDQTNLSMAHNVVINSDCQGVDAANFR